MTRDSNAARDIHIAEASQPRRLVGWLVSYGLDSDGAAFEIRTGRAFIGAAIVPSDRNAATGANGIVLKDDTVSSVHVAVLADAKHQIFIQDIFSDHGTFITKAASEDETKVNGVVQLEHGDWIRVGENIRFQVCIINGRRK